MQGFQEFTQICKDLINACLRAFELPDPSRDWVWTLNLTSGKPFHLQIEVADSGRIRKIGLVKLWKWEPENLPSVIHSIRTAIAATISLAVARLFGLPEAYWAAIATLVVMQSTLGATLLISVERIVATALGALAGALLANYFTGNLLVFAAAVFALGLLCAGFRMGKSAYRYASITLAIIVLIPRSNAAWIIALHRFFEVSVGIVVALALAAVWPEHQPESAKQSGE
jgi:uncharacterized membrane protein YccC